MIKSPLNQHLRESLFTDFPVIEDTQIQGRMVVSHNFLNFHPNLSGKFDLRIVFRRVGSTTTALSQPKDVQLPNWKAPTPKQKQAKSKVIPLMVQKSGDHQLEAGSLSTMIYGFYHVFCIHPRWFSRRISEPPIVSLRIQSMIGVYNHLQNAWYLGSITILRFGDWILRLSTPDTKRFSHKKRLALGKS